MLKRAVSDLASLVFPDVCPVCGSMMSDGERFVCTACRYRIPLTGFCREADNPMWRKFWGLVPVERAAALYWFIDGSDWRRLIHDFKYGGKWLLAVRIGRWLGAELAAGGLYGDVDVVVPVPLHWRKRISRGYNQSEYIAEGVAHSLGVPCDFRSVRRRVNNPSQTQQRHGDRWGERGRHIRGAASAAAARETCPAGGRCLHDGSDGDFVRRSDFRVMRWRCAGERSHGRGVAQGVGRGVAAIFAG